MSSFSKLGQFNKDPNQTLQTLQTNIENSLRDLLNNQLLSGTFLKTKLEVGTNTINNPLQRQLQGYFITNQDAHVSTYLSSSTPKQIKLVSDAQANVSIYLF